MTQAVIAGYVRSPFQFAHKGGLAKTRPDDLAAAVVKGLMEKTGIKPTDIEDVLLGCAFPEGEQGMNLARMVSFIAGVPQSAGAATINRYCVPPCSPSIPPLGRLRWVRAKCSCAEALKA